MLIYQAGGVNPRPLIKPQTSGAMTGMTYGMSPLGPVGMAKDTAPTAQRTMTLSYQEGGRPDLDNNLNHARTMERHQQMQRAKDRLYQFQRDREETRKRYPSTDSVPYMGPVPETEADRVVRNDSVSTPPQVPLEIEMRMARDRQLGKSFPKERWRNKDLEMWSLPQQDSTPPRRHAIADNKYGNPIYWDTAAPDTTGQGRGILYKCGGGMLRK